MLSKRILLVLPEGQKDVQIKELKEHTEPSSVTKSTEVHVVKDIKTFRKSPPSLAIYTPKVLAIIRRQIRAPVTLDSGIEVNVMLRSIAEHTRLII
jgi:hypothetical protein